METLGRGRRGLAVIVLTAFTACSSIPVTPLLGQDGNTVRRDRYECTRQARQDAITVSQASPSAGETAAGIGAELASLALALAVGGPFTGAPVSSAPSGYTVDPERERIAYTGCMEARGYAVDTTTGEGLGRSLTVRSSLQRAGQTGSPQPH